MASPTAARQPLLSVDSQTSFGRQASLASVTTEVELSEVSFPPLFFVPSCRIFVWTALSTVPVVLSLTVWKESLEERADITSEDILKWVSIPVVSLIFTYVHIWIALYLTFYPLRFIGCLQIPHTNVGCGWQGIVPNRAEFMARIAVDNLLKVIKLRDVTDRIDPKIVVEELESALNKLITKIMETVAKEEVPDVWDKLPDMVKKELVHKVREDIPETIGQMIKEIKDNIELLIDLKQMVCKALTDDPGLLCNMFIAIGYKELVFIRNFGATMGLVFGVIQVIVYLNYNKGWMLPTFGGVVGSATNWIALFMIFSPAEPVMVCCGRIRLQGLFLQRQVEAGAAFSNIISNHVLHSKHLIAELFTSHSADRIFEMTHRNIHRFCDSYVVKTQPVIRLLAGKDKFDRCKKEVANYVLRSLPKTMRHAEKYMQEVMDLETELSQRMAAMSATDFEQMLHPVFQQDEWKLVLLGGVLGVFVGFAQWWALGSP